MFTWRDGEIVIDPTHSTPTLESQILPRCDVPPLVLIDISNGRGDDKNGARFSASSSTVMGKTEPRLPEDLEREIFELTGCLYHVTWPRLLLVARRVKSWLEPLLYKTLVVDGLSTAHHIASLATCRPPDFFAKVVRRLALSADSHTPTNILSLCKGVTHLAIADDILREHQWSINPVLFSLRNVERLVFAARELRCLDASAPVFSQLTHLTLLDFSYDKLPPFVSALPSLTHLALLQPPTCSIVQEFLAECPRLQILVLIASSLHWAIVAAASTTPRPTTLTDDRLVICVSKDWKEGVSEGHTYWDVAEEFVRDKRNGSVDASSYLALGDSK
ncbi:hypothetical protein C8F01DRAFT_1370382 [Mycena amicta]|nr:hypothetical protein C8F01DRAFT_1370382 [Mycena amicta]